MLNIIYKGKDLNIVKKEVQKSFDFVYNFFGFSLKNLTVQVCNSRLEYNKILNKKKSDDWEVGSVFGIDKIIILSPIAFKNESCHDQSEFASVLKHEICHIYIRKLSRGNSVPLWLNEGVSQYVAGQNTDCNNGNIYIEDNFCEKLGTQKGWEENVNYSAYQIASLFVFFLIKKLQLAKYCIIKKYMNIETVLITFCMGKESDVSFCFITPTP